MNLLYRAETLNKTMDRRVRSKTSTQGELVKAANRLEEKGQLHNLRDLDLRCPQRK